VLPTPVGAAYGFDLELVRRKSAEQSYAVDNRQQPSSVNLQVRADLSENPRREAVRGTRSASMCDSLSEVCGRASATAPLSLSKGISNCALSLSKGISNCALSRSKGIQQLRPEPVEGCGESVDGHREGSSAARSPDACVTRSAIAAADRRRGL
jgi:hypothetical protein